MKSAPGGKPTSEVEVTNISQHGFWLLIGNREWFLPFETYPWFKGAPVGQILHVELPGPGHLYWPDLDVDLAVESIEHPERFPLVARVWPKKRTQPKRDGRRRLVARRSAHG